MSIVNIPIKNRKIKDMNQFKSQVQKKHELIRVFRTKFFLLTLIAVNLSFESKSQLIDLENLEIIPISPTVNDEIKIDVTVIFGYSSSGLMSYEVTIEDQIIKVEGCYFEGSLGSPSFTRDTMLIGELPANEYLIQLITKSNYSNDPMCEMVYGSDTVLIELEVVDEIVKTTKRELERNKMKITTNIISSRLDILNENDYPINLIIWNQFGQILEEEEVKGKTERDINLNKLNNGIYYCGFLNKGQLVKIEKILKI